MTRARVIVPKVIFLAAALALARVGDAQTGGPAANISAVVRGGVVVVSYDLNSTDANAVYSVVLEVSTDGGQTFAVRPRTVSGDVGPAVRPGTGKQITWEAARDVENLQLDRYRYRVTAEPVRRQALAAGTQQPTRQPAQPVARVGRSNGRRWGGIALMGAGGGLIVLGTTALKTDDYLTNKPLVFAGIAAAAGGAVLLAMSGTRDSVGTQIVIGPKGFMVQHRLRFGPRVEAR